MRSVPLSPHDFPPHELIVSKSPCQLCLKNGVRCTRIDKNPKSLKRPRTANSPSTEDEDVAELKKILEGKPCGMPTGVVIEHWDLIFLRDIPAYNELRLSPLFYHLTSDSSGHPSPSDFFRYGKMIPCSPVFPALLGYTRATMSSFCSSHSIVDEFRKLTLFDIIPVEMQQLTEVRRERSFRSIPFSVNLLLRIERSLETHVFHSRRK